MMKKLLLLTMLLMTTVIQMSADNLSVHFPNITMYQGDTEEMTVSYTTDYENLNGFQMEFTLPDGIFLSDVKISSEVRASCPYMDVMFSDHRAADNKTVVVCFPDGGNDCLPAGNHPFLILTFQSDLNLEKGKYDVKTSEILFARELLGVISVDNQSFSITFEGEPAPDTNTLVLWHVDGTTTSVALNQMPRVEFLGDKLRITSSVLHMEYPRSEICRFTYKRKKDIHVGVAQTEHAAIDFQRDGDRLIFQGVRKADGVEVYSPDGKRIPVKLAESAQGVSLSLSSIPRGVYVLSVNGKTSKISLP